MAKGKINPNTGRVYPKPLKYETRPRPVKPEVQQAAELRAIHAELAILERQRVALEARDKLMTFTKFTSPDHEDPDDITKSRYKPAPFHVAVAEALEEVEKGEIKQLIFCMPPRHGKTELATKRFAAWYAGRHPDQNVAVASYSDDMASDMGGDVRAIAATPQFRQVFPDFKLRRGGNSKSNLETTRGGRLVFVGRGGALTGRGAHVLLIDDLYKDHEEARSQAIRDLAWHWFTKVAMTRRMGRKLVIITMTRWHSDDIIGRLTDPENPNYNAIEAKKWKIIRLPAIAEEDDPLGREPGEPLWPDGPDTFDLDFLSSQQRLDPLGFAALYQQTPTVADGVLFKRETLKFYRPDELPDDLTIYGASDHAVGLKQRNDPSVLLMVGVDKQNNIYVLPDIFWQRAPTDQVVEAMLTMASMRHPLLWWAGKDHISTSIGPFLRKRMGERDVYLNIREVPAVGDKSQRAQSIAARAALGYVYLPRDAHWTERAVNEMLAFPNGTHDDFVDTIALIGLGLQSQHAPKPAPKKPVMPQFGTLAWVKQQDTWQAQQQKRRSAGGF